MAAAAEIVQQGLHLEYDLGHFTFLCTALQHSEEPHQHEMNMELVVFQEAKWGADHGQVKMLRQFCQVRDERGTCVRGAADSCARVLIALLPTGDCSYRG